MFGSVFIQVQPPSGNFERCDLGVREKKFEGCYPPSGSFERCDLGVRERKFGGV